MALEFIHVKLLEYTHTPVFLDAGLRYRVEKKLVIFGRLSDLQNPEGVAAIFSQERLVLGTAHDYEDIYLNGVFFGRGRIENIQFEGGLMVRDENYTYTITCFEEGDLSNAIAGVYAGLTWSEARRIEELSENFEFKTDDKGESTYTHSVTVRFGENSDAAEGIALAKSLAAVFFNATSGLGAFMTSYAGLASAKRLYSEAYNVIDAACSFTETVRIPRERNGNYSYSLSYSLEQGSDGFADISETLKLTGLTNPRYAGALEGLNAMGAGAFGRVQTVYSQYAFSDAPLFSQPISRRVATDKFTGEITVELTYSNNPRYHEKAIWEYTIETSRDENGYYTVSESGSVVGIGRSLKDKYARALEFFQTDVEPSVATRVDDFYQQVSGRSLALLLTNQKFGKNEFEGSIEYSFTYTDNNLFADEDIRKVDATISVSNPVHLVQKYNIFNQKEIVQPQNQSTLGQIQYDIRLRGTRGTSLDTYLVRAKSIVAANLPVTTDRFIESVQYSLQPQTNEFTFSLTIIFVGTPKTFSDVSLT